MSEMSEFIKRGTIYEKLDAIGGCHATDAWAQGWDKAIDEAISIVENTPAADAVEVVRCKDCKYYCCVTDEETQWCNFHNIDTIGDLAYCSCGERRSDNGQA